MKILVVEDDLKINAFICKGLASAGYFVESVRSGTEALDYLRSDASISLMVLDLMLPGIDGLEVLEATRNEGNEIPVIILSAKRTVDEKVKGLQHGADDYLVKPFAFSELLTRIQVQLRRLQGTSKPQATKLSHFGITMDLLTRKVTRDGRELDIHGKEFSLLEYLLQNPERVLSKTMILENVYGYSFDTQTNIVDVLVCRLRNKLDKEFDKKLIHTLRGVGYVLKEN